jgi:hypothetical protein
MSLSQKIAAALDDPSANFASPSTVSVEEQPHRLSLALDMASPVGVRCRSLEFNSLGSSARPIEQLRAWADRLAVRATYLMEPLKVVEADDLEGEVLLRSQTPTPRQGRRAFYEVRINRSGSLQLSRVSFDESSRRRGLEPFTLTREVLERLVDDLTTSAA